MNYSKRFSREVQQFSNREHLLLRSCLEVTTCGDFLSFLEHYILGPTNYILFPNFASNLSTLLLRCRPPKIGLTSFNVVARRTSVFDEPRPGAPKTAITEDIVKKIHDLVLVDRRLKAREIAETKPSQKTAWVISCMKYWA